MAHWRAVLPEGAMLEVQYEALVGNFEEEARRILEHCGLEWDERCLEFHKTKRRVRVPEAIDILVQEEAGKLVDMDKVV